MKTKMSNSESATGASPAKTNAASAATPRLTQLSHGGGCGCKIAPGVLEQILAKTAPQLVPPQLLVGIERHASA